MDWERFLEELPKLFDDYPRSEHPRDRRFQSVAEDVENLACENNLARDVLDVLGDRLEAAVARMLGARIVLEQPGELLEEAISFH